MSICIFKVTGTIFLLKQCHFLYVSNFLTSKLSCSVDFTAKFFELWRTKSTLWTRLESHKEEKFVSCPECTKLFALETTLKKHL
jgi:hypothetical protein